jgi:hypothetical protein
MNIALFLVASLADSEAGTAVTVLVHLKQQLLGEELETGWSQRPCPTW